MIGGEFEIDINNSLDSFTPVPDTYYYASGRSALYQILKSLNTLRRQVWLPDYLCHTIIDAVLKSGYDYTFYKLNEKLMVSTSALDLSGFKDGDIVLIINYFGLQNICEVSKEIKNKFPSAIVIEDDVQAYFSFVDDNNPYADYRFTSLRKWFPVADGGLVRTKCYLQEATRNNSFALFKICGGLLKFRRGESGLSDKDYLKLFEEGSRLIDENFESKMTLLSQQLFAGVDILEARTLRQQNSQYILDGLKQLGVEPLIPISPDKVPLFVPICISNRDEVRRMMFREEIYCPVHWPLPKFLQLKRGYELSQTELSLIVDQRYSQKEMDMILSLLNKCKL